MGARLFVAIGVCSGAAPLVEALATPLGRTATASQPHVAFANRTSSGAIAVAIVGNGPLSEEDRLEIGGAQEVYRFNSMPNLRFGERVGRVFVRRAGDHGDEIWGVPYTRLYCPRIKEAEEVIIIVKGQGSGFVSPAKLKWMRQHFARVEVAAESVKSVTIEGKTYRSDAKNRWSKYQQMFSSGFVGLAHVLKSSKAVARGSPVHIFGMNWKRESVHAAGHRNVLDIEEDTIRSAKKVVVHKAAADFYKPRNSTDEDKVLWRCENKGLWPGGPSRSSVTVGFGR